LFAIKDRHNGNILLDNKGHIIHIDFGFMFSNAPGGINFESAPFKLTAEYVQIMGGVNSVMFEYYKSLLNKAFYEVRKHLDDIISMIEIMFKDSNFP
jgi:phosphatidylinositol kinase/protein kinase (PI-3  family)